MRRLLPLILLAACGGEEPTEEPKGCEPGQELVNGDCVTPGPEECLPGSRVGPEGQCLAAGVPLSGCPAGFEAQEGGPCLPVLPAEPCAPGTLAVPGDSACRPVMDCGEGPWGTLPVDEATIHVDGSYQGGFEDGSQTRPYSTIGDAVAAAAPGAFIAVAAGSYAEDVVVRFKPLQIWGVCPDLVEVVGQGDWLGAVSIVGPSATGTEVGGLATTGAAVGVAISGAEDVVFDRVWVHDLPNNIGFEINDGEGPTSVLLRDSLVEATTVNGLYAGGVTVDIERTVIRDVAPRPGTLDIGRAVSVGPSCPPGGCDETRPSLMRISQSLFERTYDSAIYAAGSELHLTGTVLRDTFPRASDQNWGAGLQVTACNLEDGCSYNAPATAFITGGLLERNHDVSLRVNLSTATIDGLVIRDTQPRQVDMGNGRGLSLEGCGPLSGCDPPVQAVGDISGLLVERSYDLGVFVMASLATIDGSVVRSTRSRLLDQELGRGISIQHACFDECDPAAPADATMTATLVEDNQDAGIYVHDSRATVIDSRVVGTQGQTADGKFGDGIQVVMDPDATTWVELFGTRVDDSARAGVASFGAPMSLQAMRIACSAFPLTAAVYLEGPPPSVDDLGENLCGCPEPNETCKLVDAGLTPPSPL